MDTTDGAAFGALWSLESSRPCDGEGLYFAFDLPRGQDDRLAEILPTLEPRSRLHAALIELWRGGGRLRQYLGLLTLPTPSASQAGPIIEAQPTTRSPTNPGKSANGRFSA